MPKSNILAPFPYFGGKARIAETVWQHLGDVRGYVEPFFGSGAVFLNRPQPFKGVETVNEVDGLVCNFWRAVQAKPDEVAQYADWLVNENDLHARHAWLVERKDSLQAKLEGDPEYYDAKIAGWWCWGVACWIGSGFCSGKGPWQVQEVDGVRQLVQITSTNGVSRRCVHLSNAGEGVLKKSCRDTPSENGIAGCGEQGLHAWMQALCERLRRVRVCCGDWRRVCGGRSGNALSHFFAGGKPCGIFLDPPYADTANREDGCYRVDSLSVAHDVREWAIEHGDDPRLRIALCGYEGEHTMPQSWKCVAWKANGGMASLSKSESQGKANCRRERIWFSPHCSFSHTFR